MSESSAVDNEHEPTGPPAVVMPHEFRHARCDAAERVPVRVAGKLVGRNAVILHDTALREEFLDRVQHLRIHGDRALAPAADDNNVVVATDEVRAVTDRYKWTHFVNNWIRVRFKGPYIPIAVSSLSPVSTQILMSASLRSAMVSGTPSCKRSSMAVAPSKRRPCSISSETASTFSSRSF